MGLKNVYDEPRAWLERNHGAELAVGLSVNADRNLIRGMRGEVSTPLSGRLYEIRFSVS